MDKFLHVAIGFEGKVVSFEEIQKAFGTRAGWARYSPNCWIVITDQEPQVLAEEIRKLCANTDSIFVCELNIGNNGGYLQKEIWEWIKKHQSTS